MKNCVHRSICGEKKNNLQPEVSMTSRSGLFLYHRRRWGKGVHKKTTKKHNIFFSLETCVITGKHKKVSRPLDPFSENCDKTQKLQLSKTHKQKMWKILLNKWFSKFKKKTSFDKRKNSNCEKKYYNQILANYWTLIVREKKTQLKYLQQQKNNS